MGEDGRGNRTARFRGTSTTSRVVPGWADTMAAGRWASQFMREDFPALGAPTSATLAGKGR